MRLLELEPVFLRYERSEDGSEYAHVVETIAEAQGVQFLCPKCFRANGGAVGTHSVRCWARDRGVPDGVRPGPGRWSLVGTGLADLSLVAAMSSVQLTSGCLWHGLVTNGEVTGVP